MKGLKAKAIDGVKWTSLGGIIDHGIGFIIFIILARLLAPEDFGLVALASTFVHFMGPYVSLGLGTAVVQRDNLTPDHLNSAFWANVALGGLLALGLYFGAAYIAAFFDSPALEPVLQWLSLSFLFLSLSSIQSSLVRRDMNFKALAVRSNIAMLFGGIVGVYMAVMDYGVWSLVARQLVQSGIAVLLLWRISRWRPEFSFSFGRFWELARFGLAVSGSEMMVLINRRSDNLLIGYFLGPVMLGYYTVAYRLLMIMFQVLSKTIYQVGMPAFARMQDNKERVATAFYDMTQLTAFLAFPLFLGASATAIELVPVLYGDKWSASIPVMQLLLLIGVVQCLLRPMAAVIVGLGRPVWRFRLQIIDAIANLIGFLIAVQWGIVAVAASYVIVGYALTPLWYLVLKRIIPVHIGAYLSIMKGTVLASIIMLAGIFGVRHAMAGLSYGITIEAVVLVTVGGILYLAAIWAIDPKGTKMVAKVVKKLLSKSHKKNTD